MGLRANESYRVYQCPNCEHVDLRPLSADVPQAEADPAPDPENSN
jgi:hypothetical protein